MSVAYNPKIVTNGLVLALDASNTKSVPKTNLLTTWADYGGNQANYEILGPYSIKLKNTTTGWVGNFPATVSSSGKYVITFTYYSDIDGSSLVLDNDGIMDNAYNTTLTANINPQTYTGSVDVNTTGNIIHFFRRNGGGNIYVTNVSYFKLETTWTDLSGNGNNGTLTNGPTYNSTNGGSLVFDGTNDYVSSPASSSLGKSINYTTSAWVKYSDVGYTSWMIICDSVDYNVGGGYMMWLDDSAPSTGKRLASYDGSIGWQYGTVRILPNIWAHVCISKNNNALSFYVNGLFNVTITYNFNSSTSSTAVDIGGSNRNGYPFNGNIAQVSIYNRALTAAEVQQNFNATRGRYGI